MTISSEKPKPLKSTTKSVTQTLGPPGDQNIEVGTEPGSENDSESGINMMYVAGGLLVVGLGVVLMTRQQ